MDRPAVRDATLLLLRLVLGVIFVAHGYRMIFLDGMDETTGQFSAWSVPQPRLSAWIAALTHLIGGALLVIGLLTTIVAGVLALIMLSATYFVGLENGLFVEHGGMEYTLVLTISLVMIVVFGAGRASVDGVLIRG